MTDQTHPSSEQRESRYPEHAKLSAVMETSHAIGEFIDYGLPRMGLVLCEKPLSRRNQSRWPSPTNRSIQRILAEWFEIDLDKIEDEKRAMLASMRAAQGSSS